MPTSTGAPPVVSGPLAVTSEVYLDLCSSRQRDMTPLLQKGFTAHMQRGVQGSLAFTGQSERGVFRVYLLGTFMYL